MDDDLRDYFEVCDNVMGNLNRAIEAITEQRRSGPMNRHKRIQPRQSNAQWTPATTENVFGLRVLICPECRSFNPYSRKPIDPTAPFIDPAAFNTWEVPTHCHECGAELPKEAKDNR